MRIIRLLLLPSIALPCGALAQSPSRELAVGQTAGATLGPSDPQRGGRAFHTWQLSVLAAGPVQIDMTSDSVDAYLVLQDSTGAFLDSDDNSGGGLNARLVFDAAGPAHYRILARSSTRTDGAYTIRAAVALPSNEGVVGIIAKGQEINATISQTDPKLSSGKPYQAYVFEGAGGDSITVELRSDAFDTFLILQDATGRSLIENDDADGELNSKLGYRLPRSGRYRIVATVFDPTATGRFTLRVR